MFTHILFINSRAQKKKEGTCLKPPGGSMTKLRCAFQCGSDTNYIIIPVTGTSYQSLNKDSLNSILIFSEGWHEPWSLNS